YDGKGGHFLDYSIPGSSPTGTSMFVSRDDAGKHLVAVILNESPDTSLQARVDLNGCGKAAAANVYTYAGVSFRRQAGHPSETHLSEVFLPYSINVIDVQFAEAMPGSTEK